MKVDTYKCDGDGCDEMKRETNHWFLANVVTFTHEAGKPDVTSLVVYPWLDSLVRTEGIKHFCGETCLLKFVGTAITQLK